MAHVSATGKLGIMLVEDHSTFRGVLAFVLDQEPDMEVVAQAGSLAEAREALEAGGPDRAPDVAVLDLALSDGDGGELVGELRRRSPGVRIMVLSASVWAQDAEEALGAGADAVLDKVTSYRTIAEEVRRLAGR
jgi:DNA-binding NarL/FixJ family response regulator